jgi:hypothetical protein
MASKPTVAHEIGWPRRIRTPGEAVRYINATGYCVLFPVQNVPLPSLYYAVTRRNPHQEMIWDLDSERIWRWKDELPRRRRAFYGKYFRGRGTFISLAYLPYFLALRESAASVNDHQRFYARGHISDDARIVWQMLAEHGPLATLELRHLSKMDTKAGNKRFKRAIVELQSCLVAVRFGVEQETGAWASGRYELTCRVFPNQVAAASRISLELARAHVARKFLEFDRHVPPIKLARLFGWSRQETIQAMSGISLRRSERGLC